MNAARRETQIPPRRTRATGGDEWTDATAPVESGEKEPTKKMSLNIPETAHKAAKVGAAERGATIVGEYIELVQARAGLTPWPADVVESVLTQIRESGEPLPTELLDAAVHQLEADREAGAAETKRGGRSARSRKSA